MKHLRERLLLGFFLGGVPLLFVGLVLRPSLRRMDAQRQRMNAASAELQKFPKFTPVRGEEHALLEDPAAPWRRRMPVLQGEGERLAHYHRVVSQTQQAWRRAGFSPLGFRAGWDPIRARFTLGGGLEGGGGEASQGVDAPELQVRGWVLEATFGGGTEQLFRALGVLPQVEPLLEPVGLRWDASLPVPRQSLLLRNLVVTP